MASVHDGLALRARLWRFVRRCPALSISFSGTPRIRLPSAPAHYPVHIVVEWEDLPTATKPGWPSAWFEETAGSIDDPTFVRPPQGAYETREGLE